MESLHYGKRASQRTVCSERSWWTLPHTLSRPSHASEFLIWGGVLGGVFLGVFFNVYCPQTIGWGAISTALHIMKYIYILYNSLKYCIVYIRHIK